MLKFSPFIYFPLPPRTPTPTVIRKESGELLPHEGIGHSVTLTGVNFPFRLEGTARVDRLGGRESWRDTCLRKGRDENTVC